MTEIKLNLKVSKKSTPDELRKKVEEFANKANKKISQIEKEEQKKIEYDRQRSEYILNERREFNRIMNIKKRKKKKEHAKKYVYVPTLQPDGTYRNYKTLKLNVGKKELNKALVQVYTNKLVNVCFRNPSLSWMKIRKKVNKEFKQEYNMSDSEVLYISKKVNSMEEELNKVGLGKDSIVEMINQDLKDRKGNRDRLLQLVVNMWDKIDSEKADKETEETKKVIEMMKKVIDTKPTKESPQMLQGKIEEDTQEEKPRIEYKESIDINKLNEVVGLEKTE